MKSCLSYIFTAIAGLGIFMYTISMIGYWWTGYGAVAGIASMVLMPFALLITTIIWLFTATIPTIVYLLTLLFFYATAAALQSTE